MYHVHCCKFGANHSETCEDPSLHTKRFTIINLILIWGGGGSIFCVGFFFNVQNSGKVLKTPKFHSMFLSLRPFFFHYCSQGKFGHKF